MFEIETANGVVSSTSNVLAQAMAELIAAEHRASEADLLEAVAIDLTDAPAPRGATTSAA